MNMEIWEPKPPGTLWENEYQEHFLGVKAAGV